MAGVRADASSFATFIKYLFENPAARATLYKSETPAGYPNADLYQLLAYCTVLGLRRGHLVYAKGSAEPAHHVVRRCGIEIICHALDLDTEPALLLARMNDLAAYIADALASQRPPQAALASCSGQ